MTKGGKGKKGKKGSAGDVPYQCLDCGHGADGEWGKNKYGPKACPACGSAKTGPMEVTSSELVGDPRMMDQSASILGAVPTYKETPQDQSAAKKAPKGAQVKVAAPFVQSIPKMSTSVDIATRSSQEEQFAGLLSDVGVKQADLLASIIMQSDKAEDPKFVDTMLRRYHIPLIQRQVVVDAWAGSVGADPFLIGEGEGPQGGHGSPMAQMVNEMREMFMMKMMSQMLMGGDQQQRPPIDPSTRPPPEVMIPMTDDAGEIMVDPTTGQVIKVPASLYMVYKGKQGAEKPSSLQEFMAMQNFNMENQKMMFEAFGGANKGPDVEMMAKVAALETETRMRALDQERSNQIGELQAQLQIEKALKQQEQQLGAYISEKDKQIKELAMELEAMRQSREVSYQETQVDMARKTNDLVMDTVKEGTKEVRDARREFRGLLVDNMKNQQFVDAARDRVSGGPVKEVPLDQVERDIDGMGGGGADDQAWNDVMLSGAVGIDYRLLEPEDREDQIL